MTELWRRDTLQRIDVARRQVRGLRHLTLRFLPRTEPWTGGHGDWPLVGFAMLGRACGTAECVIALAAERRAVDAGVLSRALFEQVVTFAWIAVDPAVNTDAWVRWDRQQRIKYDNDLRDRGGQRELEPEVRQEFEDFIAAGPAMPDNLAERAEKADVQWSPRVKAIDADPTSERSFRGMYHFLYRGDSRYTHGAVGAIEPLVIGSSDRTSATVVPVEMDPGPTSPFTRAPILYALGLLVAEVALDLPGMERAVDGVFAH